MRGLSKQGAEKMFNRKASPAADMEPRAFIKQEIRKVGKGIKNYARNVAGGAKIVGGAVKSAAKRMLK